jgi:hypothetical protein
MMSPLTRMCRVVECFHIFTNITTGLIKRTGVWEEEQAVLLVKYLNSSRPTTFIDIGAHVGMHSLYAAALGYPGNYYLFHYLFN